MTEFRMLVGLPASGKSSYAEKLQEEGYEVFSSDEMREKAGMTDNGKIFETLHSNIIHSLKEGRSCILDATNLNRKKRIVLLDRVKETGVTAACDLFLIPVPILKERNRNRKNNHGVSNEVIDMMLKRFECPWFAEGFDEISVHPYEGVYEPEFSREDLMAFAQDNPHHALTVGEHEEKAREYVEKKFIFHENLPALIEAAKHHDDGKMFAKTFFDMKGNPTQNAHYYGHDNIGSYLFLLHAFCSDAYEKNGDSPLTEYERLYGGLLIGMHMRPLTAWRASKKAKERDELRYGKEFILDLERLCEADMFARNPSEEDERRLEEEFRKKISRLKKAKPHTGAVHQDGKEEVHGCSHA